jgi:hypothetical protein
MAVCVNTSATVHPPAPSLAARCRLYYEGGGGSPLASCLGSPEAHFLSVSHAHVVTLEAIRGERLGLLALCACMKVVPFSS